MPAGAPPRRPAPCPSCARGGLWRASCPGGRPRRTRRATRRSAGRTTGRWRPLSRRARRMSGPRPRRTSRRATAISSTVACDGARESSSATRRALASRIPWGLFGRRPHDPRRRRRDPVVAAERTSRPRNQLAMARRKMSLRRRRLIRRAGSQRGLQSPVVSPAECRIALVVRLDQPPRQEARQRPPRAQLGQGAGRRRGAPAGAALRLVAVGRARRRCGRSTGDGDPPHDRGADHDQREEESDLSPTHGSRPSGPSVTPIQPASSRARNGAAPGSPGPRTDAGTS